MSLLFSVVILLELLSGIFHFSVNADAIIRVAVAVCGVLTVLGFVKKNGDETINNLDDLKNYVNEGKKENEEETSETTKEDETLDENEVKKDN